MTVCYVIIIVIIWKKGSVDNKSERSSDEANHKSKFRRLITSKRSDERQIESSIRNIRSLGVIPRAKIKTVKMTLVIVVGS